MATALIDIDAAPALEHLLDIRITFEPVQIFPTPVGTRMTFVVSEGRFQGPQLAGTVVPGGGDWVVLGTDGVARLDVRATLRTADGAHIHLTSTGRVMMSDAVRQRFSSGESIRHDELYARSSPLFETGDERYRWLNGVHTVAVNQLSLSEVQYRVFAVR